MFHGAAFFAPRLPKKNLPIRAFPLGLPNGKCLDDLALKPKNHQQPVL